MVLSQKYRIHMDIRISKRYLVLRLLNQLDDHLEHLID